MSQKTIGVLLFTTPYDKAEPYIEPLILAGEKMGHRLVRLYQPYFTFLKTDGRIQVFYQGQPFSGVDGIIARPNIIMEPSLHQCTTDLLQEAGFFIVNRMDGFAKAKNKLEQRTLMHRLNIPMPKWAIVRTTDQAVFAAERIGFPIIAKVAFGSIGCGVFYAENTESLMPIIDYLSERMNPPVIIEEFIAEANRQDLRVFVIDGKIIAAMQRHARAGDVRANATIGGTGAPADLSAEEQSLALRTAAAFDLDIAGIDLIRSKRGPLVMEINSNPGFTELAAATGVDVAGAIIDYAVKKIESVDKPPEK